VIGYEFYEKRNIEAFWAQLDNQGYDQASVIARDLKQRDTAFLLPESDVNDLAFILLGKDMKKGAVAIFKYNLAAGRFVTAPRASGCGKIGHVPHYKKQAQINGSIICPKSRHYDPSTED
jgi:L-serine deaminase